jgi:hypothetical protein
MHGWTAFGLANSMTYRHLWGLCGFQLVGPRASGGFVIGGERIVVSCLRALSTRRRQLRRRCRASGRMLDSPRKKRHVNGRTMANRSQKKSRHLNGPNRAVKHRPDDVAPHAHELSEAPGGTSGHNLRDLPQTEREREAMAVKRS